MPFDSQIRLRQLHNPEVSGFVVSIISKYLATGSGIPVNTGTLTGAFYPLKSNPSGYLSSISTGGLVDYPSLATNNANLLNQIDALYYPRSNPSGYGVGSGSGISFNTGDFASITDHFHNTGFTLRGSTNSFLKFNNTGFLLGSSHGEQVYLDAFLGTISGYELRNSTLFFQLTEAGPHGQGMSFVRNQSPILTILDAGILGTFFKLNSYKNTGLFYDVTEGKLCVSGFSGWGITGTNAFALLDARPNSQATGFKYVQGKEYYQSGSGTKIDYYKKTISGFEVSGYLSTVNFLSSSGYIDTKISNLKTDVSALSGKSVLKSDLILIDEVNQPALRWGYNTRNLETNDGLVTLDWQNRQLIFRDGEATVDWKSGLLRTDDPPANKVDWFNGQLSGLWFVENIRVSGQPVLTGSMNQFLAKASGDSLYYPLSNPDNYVTASYVSQFATKTDAVSRTSLSQNIGLHLTDIYGVTEYNNLGFKRGNFFYIKGPSGKNVIDFYVNSLTGFDINAKSIKVNGSTVLTSANSYLKLGVATSNTEVMFNDNVGIYTPLYFKQGESFYLQNATEGYIFDIFSGFIYGPNGNTISIGSAEIDGYIITSPYISVNSLPVLTQILNTGSGSGIYHSTDGANAAYLKSLTPGIGMRISGSGNSLVLSPDNFYYNSANYSSFGNLISGMGSTSGTIFVSSPVSIASNLTIPRNIELVFLNSGLLSVSSNATLQFFNKFQAQPRQIFSVSGNYVFSGNQNAGETSFAQWFGVIADGNKTTGTDNWRALINLNKYLYANDGLNVKFPKGIICTSHYSWLIGVRNAHLDFCGATGQYIGPSQQYGVIWFLAVNNETTLEYPIGNDYQLVYKDPQSFIYSTVTGSKSVRLKVPSQVTGYSSGSWLQVAGYEQQGGGFPRNYRYFEYRKITDIDTGSGILTLDRPLQNVYNERWFNYTGDANVGPACLMSLDRNNFYHFAEDITVENLTIIGANSGQTYLTTGFYGLDTLDQTAGLMVAGCKSFLGKNIRAQQMFVQAGDTYTFENCQITYVEPDKQVNKLICKNSDFDVFIQGVGIDYIELKNCNIYRFLAVYPRRLHVEDCDYYTLTYNQGFSLPSTYYGTSYSFQNNRVHFRPNSSVEIFGGFATESSASYPNAQAPNACSAISGGTGRFATDATVNDFSLRLSMGRGTEFKSASGKRGIVEDITYDSGNRRFLIDYIGTPIESGDRLYYHTLLNLFAHGNTRAVGSNLIPQSTLIPAQNYVNSTDGVGPTHFNISWKDFVPGTLMKQGIDGYLDEISINITKASTTSGDPRLVISITEPYGVTKEMSVDTSVTGIRKMTPFMSYGDVGTDSFTTFGSDYIRTLGVYVYGIHNSGSSGFLGTLSLKGKKQ